VREQEAIAAALRASRLEAQLTAARLEALQMQLHPHFLFNALNSISVMVLKGDREEAIRAIRQLADLLRVALRAVGTQERSLEEELAFLEAYLAIERLRFADQLTVEFDIAPESLASLVPCLILQPLVENAVVHGVRSRRGTGRIRVATRRESHTLQLEVWDNGQQPPAEAKRVAGVGLTITRDRLRELYGDRARFDLRAAADGGTIASISMPYHTASSRTVPGAPA
jgi:sensor histidine kinase YesM